MSRFVVESGIPIGPVSQGKCAYPFDEMKFGDSFFVAVTSPASQKRTRDQLTGAFKRWCKFNKVENVGYVTRLVEEDNVMGVRFWMVERKK